jgi:hypothetical protein
LGHLAPDCPSNNSKKPSQAPEGKEPPEGFDGDDDGHDSDGGDGGDGDGEDGKNENVTKKNDFTRLREAETVKIGAWPTVGKLKVWRNHLRKSFVAASTRPDEAFDLIIRVEDPTATFEDFATVPTWCITLNGKFLTSLTAILHGESGRRILNKDEELTKQKKRMTSFQMLFMIYAEFKQDAERVHMFNLGDLWALEVKNNSQLESFANNWDDKVQNLDKPESP